MSMPEGSRRYNFIDFSRQEKESKREEAEGKKKIT
jgi:hypothetical protein